MTTAVCDCAGLTQPRTLTNDDPVAADRREWGMGHGHHHHMLDAAPSPPSNMLTMYLSFRIGRSVDDILFMFDVLDPVFIEYRLFDADAERSPVLLKYYCRTEAGLVPAIRARAGLGWAEESW